MAREGRKPEEVAKPLWRGEVPHGQGMSIADAVRLALRNNRELPDARPTHRPGVLAGSRGRIVAGRLRASGSRCAGKGAEPGDGRRRRDGTPGSAGRAVRALPDEANPGPGRRPGHGRVRTLTTAAEELRHRRRLRHLPSLRVAVLPVARGHGYRRRRLDHSRAPLRLPTCLPGIPLRFRLCRGGEIGCECEAVAASAGNCEAEAQPRSRPA